jgi:hypothetical protein
MRRSPLVFSQWVVHFPFTLLNDYLYLNNMHNRKQIIENQKKFRKEIISSLKVEFKEAKKELSEIQTNDKVIKEEKQKLENKFNKIKISNQIENLFISEKNIYPNYYAWWDENNNQVSKLKYKDK